MNALPLSLENIDLIRIDNFLRLYAAIAAAEEPMRRNSAGAAMKRVFSVMKRIEGLSDQRTFLGLQGLTANAVIGWSKQPASGKAVPLVDSLKEILSQTELVVHDFEAHAEKDRQHALFTEDDMAKFRDQHYAARNNADRLLGARVDLVHALTPRSR
jgi:hypothetical protein